MTRASDKLTAAEVARELTAAQREWIRRSQGTLTITQSWATAAAWRDIGRPLMDAGIIAFVENPRVSRTRYTQLGLAVRAAVQSGEQP